MSINFLNKSGHSLSTESKWSHHIYNFRKSDWESTVLLKHLCVDDFKKFSKEKKELIHDEMWRNLTAEFDAIHLSKRLKMNDFHTEAFLAFEKIWLLDEKNHYNGLRKIYASMYSMDESDIHKKVIARNPDFNNLEEFLRDEFILCVCFAYDELASTRGYSEAFDLYDSFGISEVSKWIRLTARDELYHSLNAQYLLKTFYSHRIFEIPEILRSIVTKDHSRIEGYQATFLFDHDHQPEDNPFSAEFLKKCANDICRYLSTHLAFSEDSKGFQET